jgi:hypothetical protein
VSRKKIYKNGMREWLNPKGHHDTGAVSCSAEVATGEGVYKKGSKPSPYLDADLEIRDCGEQINLSFSVYGRRTSTRSRRKKIAKLRKALDIIEEGLDALEEARE